MDLATHPPSAGGQPVALGSGQILAGRYRVTAFLGGGSVGEVYEAEDLELGVRIALKVLHPGADDEQVLQRFKQEIQLARRVTHPNVCRTYDLAYHGEAPHPRVLLTMELLRGETLADRLSRQGRMKPGEALPIVRQVAGALAAAHASGVVHRDLKSANIFLEDHRAVVTDFGLAWSPDAAGPAAAGELTGSPAYMSPEQVRGEVATAATDIYALGVVLYEMVTGELPFVGASAFYTAVKRLHEPPPPPCSKVPSLDPAWNAAILRCLEREPADRFATLDEVVAALAPPAAPVQQIPAPPARHRALWFRAAACLAFLAAGTFAVFFPRIPATAPLLQENALLSARQPEPTPENIERRNRLSETLAIARERGDTAAEAKIQEELARMARAQGDLLTALRGYQKLATLLRDGGDRRELVAALQNVAAIAFELGDPDGSRGPQEEALKLARQAGDREGVARALHGLANLDRLTGDLTAAQQKYEQAFALYGELGQPQRQAGLLHEIGRLYTLRREPARALEVFARVLEICGAPDHCPLQAAVLNDIGKAYCLLGDSLTSRANHERSLKLSRAEHNETEEARALVGVGEADLDLGDPRAAQPLFEGALSLFLRLGNRNRATDALSGMARSLAAQGKYQEALSKYEESRTLRLELGERLFANDNLLAIAQLALDFDHLPEAAQSAREAARIFRELGVPEGEAKAASILARCQSGRSAVNL